MSKKSQSSSDLKGWKAIAEYLGQPQSVVQRWAGSGMPVTRKGRYATASPDELKEWLGREAGMGVPAHLNTDQDLGADLKQSIIAAKRK